MRGYFITEDQLSDIKERVERLKEDRAWSGDKSLKPLVKAVRESCYKEIKAQLEGWIKIISK